MAFARPLQSDEPAARGLRFNADEVTIAVGGRVAHPVAPATPYRIGHDGVPRVLVGPGGIVLSHRVGDACVGLAADRLEAGVALHNNAQEVVGPRNGPNNALLTYAILDADARHGPSFHGGWTTIGIVVHGDSTVSGYGPGVTVLMTGPPGSPSATRDNHANLAAFFSLWRLTFPQRSQPLAHRGSTIPRNPRRANFDTGRE